MIGKQIRRWDGMCTVTFAIPQCYRNITNGGPAEYNSRDDAPGYAHPYISWSVECINSSHHSFSPCSCCHILFLLFVWQHMVLSWNFSWCVMILFRSWLDVSPVTCFLVMKWTFESHVLAACTPAPVSGSLWFGMLAVFCGINVSSMH